MEPRDLDLHTQSAPEHGRTPAASGVLLAVRELFFRVKLETALRNLRAPVRVSSPGELVDTARAWRPSVVLLDLSDPTPSPLDALRALRADRELADLPVIGFASHVDRRLREEARRAGCTQVVSRSRISAALPELLAPYLGAS